MPDYDPDKLREIASKADAGEVSVLLRQRPMVTAALNKLADRIEEDKFGECWNCVLRRKDGKPCVHTQKHDPAGALTGLKITYCCDKVVGKCGIHI